MGITYTNYTTEDRENARRCLTEIYVYCDRKFKEIRSDVELANDIEWNSYYGNMSDKGLVIFGKKARDIVLGEITSFQMEIIIDLVTNWNVYRNRLRYALEEEEITAKLLRNFKIPPNE